MALIGIVCIAYGYFVEPYWVEVKKIELYSPKLAGTNLRIVQISDLHCDKKPINEAKLSHLINPLNPDLIIFTGDALNSRDAVGRLKDTLKGLKAKIGKYAIRGNCDVAHFGSIDMFGDTGFRLLKDQTIRLKKGDVEFYISAVDPTTKSINNVNDIAKISNEYYSIFLHHCPDFAEDLNGLNVDLYLCGHTHGGQIALPFYGAVITLTKHGKKYEAGKYKIGDTVLYVNRGLGVEGGMAPRVRFFARPEITVFDIKSKK